MFTALLPSPFPLRVMLDQRALLNWEVHRSLLIHLFENRDQSVQRTDLFSPGAQSYCAGHSLEEVVDHSCEEVVAGPGAASPTAD